MSIGGKKEKTKTESVTTPTNPAWMTGTYQNLNNQINGIGNKDPYSYVPGASDLQTQAFQGASNLTSSPNFDWASQLGLHAGTAGPSTAQGVSAGPASQATSRNFTDVDLQGYMNNGLNGMIDASRADYEATNAAARARAEAQAAWNGGARNSNNAIGLQELEGQLSRAQNTGLSQLRYDAFNSAAGLATGVLNREASTSQFNAGQSNQMSQFNTGQANAMSQFNAGQQDNALARMLQSANLLSSVGQAQGADERANLGLQAGLGEQQREIERQHLAAPLDLLQLQASLQGQIPWNLMTGSTSTGTGSTSQMGFSLDLMKLGQAMAGIGRPSGGSGSGISDGRLKQDIVPLGQGPSGDNLYAFNYLGQEGPPQYVGPMAQEVAQTHPQAVGQGPAGALTVNYNALGIPSPQQQDAARQPLSFAPDEDPLGNWSGGTASKLKQAQDQALARMGGQTSQGSPQRRRGLFGAK